MERVIIKAIHTTEEHDNAVEAIRHIMSLETPGESDLAMLETLGILVERYEQSAFPLERPSALDAIRFRMDQMGLSQTELARLTGFPKSRISEILNEKRSLTLEMIRVMSQKLAIPTDILIGRGTLTAS
jgi:HTH-type transcriptional regulator/antitoxin HigA